jgi:hypothetical protein
MLPYYTLNNGAYEYDSAGNYLQPAKYIWMAEVSQTPPNDSAVQVDGIVMSVGQYYVYNWPTNYQQGETNSTAAWMGGGSGEAFTGLYLPALGAQWLLWGWHNDCANSPYWIRSTGPYSWENGGY